MVRLIFPGTPEISLTRVIRVEPRTPLPIVDDGPVERADAARNRHDPFVQKYVFPGSNQPRLSEIAAGLERAGLAILDVENIAQHYGYTILGWLERFRANRARSVHGE